MSPGSRVAGPLIGTTDMRRCILTVLVLVLPTSSLRAQAVPSPAEFHGYELGTRYTLTSALYDYYRTLAAASPRVEYREYGRSVQGRPLPMVLIGSETNLARADEIRAASRRINGADGILPAAELEALSEETPAVVWIFIVDTDEEAGVEVLQEVAWELASREDADARSIRDDVLVIMTPLTNPDSHARYVTWHGIYDADGAATDPLAVENRAHWAMNTDGNAWGVDVNRDFGWFVTPEMRGLGREIMGWRPQLILDVHSGPNVIFLPPFPRPFHPLWPERAPDWWNALADRANRAFGERGWSFSSRKDYEGVAGVGFGLSWGMLGPATASYLFETFGGRPQKTTAFIRGDGTLATMRMAMDRHALGTWTLLGLARDRKRALHRDVHDNVERAMAEAGAGPVRGIVIPADGEGVDPAKVARLIDRLTLQEVEVRRTTAPFTLEARDFLATARPTRQSFAAGDYVVDLVQPNARLARALLDPTIDFTSPEVEVPYDRKMPYYDAPWGNLPYLFGVRAFATADAPPAGEPVRGPQPLRGGVVGSTDRPYAWVLRPGFEANQRLAVQLLRDGYNLRVFTDGFRLGAEVFPKGTLTAIRGRNPDGLAERVGTLAREHGARVHAVDGPFTDAGLTFGDDARVAPVPAPRVAVLADWPVTQDHTFGGIRSTLEGDFGFPFSPVVMETLNRADLSGYTAVVLPHGGMTVRGGPNFDAGYRGRLELDNLRDYVTGGGTLIAVQGAAAFVAGDSVLGAGVTMDGWAERTEATARGQVLREPVPEAEVVAWRPGLDAIGPPLLAAGFGPTFAAPASFPVLLTVDDGASVRTIARYGEDEASLVLDGFMLDEDRPLLAGRPFMVAAPVGRGRVIYFAEDLTFRGAWYGMNGLFINALLFGGI